MNKTIKVTIAVITTVIATFGMIAFFTTHQKVNQNNIENPDPVFKEFQDTLSIDFGFLEAKSVFDFIEPSEYELATVREISNNRQVFILNSEILDQPFFLPFKFKYPGITKIINNRPGETVVFYNPKENTFSLPDYLISNLYEVNVNDSKLWLFLLADEWYISDENFENTKKLSINTPHPVTGFLIDNQNQEIFGISTTSVGLFEQPIVYKFSNQQFYKSDTLQPEKNINLKNLLLDVVDLEAKIVRDTLTDKQTTGDGLYPTFSFQQTKNYFVIQSEYAQKRLWFVPKNGGDVKMIEGGIGNINTYFSSCAYHLDVCFALNFETSELQFIQLGDQAYSTTKKVTLDLETVTLTSIQRTQNLQRYRSKKIIDIRESKNEVGFWNNNEWNTLSILK